MSKDLIEILGTEPPVLELSEAKTQNGPSAFGQFLSRLRPAPNSPETNYTALAYAALGSALIIVGAVGLAALPDPASIRAASFYLIGGDALAGALGLAGSLVTPLAILGAFFLFLTGAGALARWKGDLADAVWLAPPVVGVAALGSAGLGWVFLLAAIALNLVVWAAIMAVIAMFAIGFLGGVLGAALDG